MKIQMEEQMNLGYFPGEEKQSALGMLGILKEAFKTTIKNGKLVLFIAFFMFIHYCLWRSADHLMLAPVYSDLNSLYALKPKDVRLNEVDPKLYKALIKDIRFILVFEFVALSLSLLILMISLAAVTHSTHEAYTAKVISFKEMFLSIGSRCKRALITAFCMLLISLMTIIAFLLAFGLIAAMTDGSVSIVFVCGLIFFGLCSYIYLSLLWILSLVVSVLEQNFSGMKAVDRARELMTGKILQGCVLVLILLLATSVTFGTFTLLAMNKTWWKISVVITLSRIWLLCLMKIFGFAVFTLFYRECKTSHAEMEKRMVYVPINSVEFQ